MLPVVAVEEIFDAGGGRDEKRVHAGIIGGGRSGFSGNRPKSRLALVFVPLSCTRGAADCDAVREDGHTRECFYTARERRLISLDYHYLPYLLPFVCRNQCPGPF